MKQLAFLINFLYSMLGKYCTNFKPLFLAKSTSFCCCLFSYLIWYRLYIVVVHEVYVIPFNEREELAPTYT